MSGIQCFIIPKFYVCMYLSCLFYIFWDLFSHCFLGSYSVILLSRCLGSLLYGKCLMIVLLFMISNFFALFYHSCSFLFVMNYDAIAFLFVMNYSIMRTETTLQPQYSAATFQNLD